MRSRICAALEERQEFQTPPSLSLFVQRQWRYVKIWERKSFFFLLISAVWWTSLPCIQWLRRQCTNSPADINVLGCYSSPHPTVIPFLNSEHCCPSKYRLTPAVFWTLDGKKWWKAVLGRSDLLFVIWSWASSSACQYKMWHHFHCPIICSAVPVPVTQRRDVILSPSSSFYSVSTSSPGMKNK